MPVISFHFEKFQAEKKKDLEAPMKIDVGTKITEVKEEDVNLNGGNVQKVLRFFYEHNIDYNPDQASISISGNLVYYAPLAEVDEVLKEWKKSKKMSAEVTRVVLNTVLLRCQIKALMISQDLGLPPHIRLPLINTKSEAMKKRTVAEYTG
jgi:hypothetical protein